MDWLDSPGRYSQISALSYCTAVFTMMSLPTAVKNPPAHAGDLRDAGSIPGLGRSPEGGLVNPLQYSCLENLMERKAWLATVHTIAQSQT